MTHAGRGGQKNHFIILQNYDGHVLSCHDEARESREDVLDLSEALLWSPRAPQGNRDSRKPWKLLKSEDNQGELGQTQGSRGTPRGPIKQNN